jgi:hypothetical protein
MGARNLPARRNTAQAARPSPFEPGPPTELTSQPPPGTPARRYPAPILQRQRPPPPRTRQPQHREPAAPAPRTRQHRQPAASSTGSPRRQHREPASTANPRRQVPTPRTRGATYRHREPVPPIPRRLHDEPVPSVPLAGAVSQHNAGRRSRGGHQSFPLAGRAQPGAVPSSCLSICWPDSTARLGVHFFVQLVRHKPHYPVRLSRQVAIIQETFNSGEFKSQT